MHSSDDLARRVAARLAADYDPNLQALTEGTLAEQGATSRSLDAFLDPATTSAIAAVIVAASQFAWQVYRDLKADREKAKEEEARRAATANREVILRRMRLRLSPSSGISEQQRDRVYEAVVDEILLQDRGE